MADTATTVHAIPTHLFGDGALARDLRVGSSIIPRAVSARELDAALGQVAEVSTPRAPEELHSCYRIQDDNLRPPKPYGGAHWGYPNQMEEAEQEERVWVDDEPSYDSDATEAERATDHHYQPRAPPAPPAAPVSVRVCLEWKPKIVL